MRESSPYLKQLYGVCRCLLQKVCVCVSECKMHCTDIHWIFSFSHSSCFSAQRTKASVITRAHPVRGSFCARSGTALSVHYAPSGYRNVYYMLAERRIAHKQLLQRYNIPVATTAYKDINLW